LGIVNKQFLSHFLQDLVQVG